MIIIYTHNYCVVSKKSFCQFIQSVNTLADECDGWKVQKYTLTIFTVFKD